MRLILKNYSFSLLFQFTFIIVILSTTLLIGSSDFSEESEQIRKKDLNWDQLQNNNLSVNSNNILAKISNGTRAFERTFFSFLENAKERFEKTLLEYYNSTNSNKGQQQLQTAKSLAINIISPIDNETVPIGSGFDILGTSTATAISNNTDFGNCYVSVIVNNIKPYRNATPSGPNGINDYSKWKFTLLPNKDNPIKEGQNKITSKLSCLAGGNSNNNDNKNNTNNTSNPTTTPSTRLTKWYSLNVTGVTMPSKANGTQTIATAMTK